MESSDGAKTAEERSARLPFRKKLLFVLIINLFLFGLIETGVRVGAYFVYGGSPYFLLYGLRSEGGDVDPDGHSVVLDGYNKFPPGRTLRQYGMFEAPTPVRINAAGLRGADFSPEKPEGTVRIVALGGSSTFGFYSRDEHTYPARLDRAFGERACPRPPVEVINAGVPHAKSHNLAAMLRGEVVDYEPDMILIYTGYNDAVVVHEANLAQTTVRWLHEHVLSFVVLKAALAKLGVQNLSRSQWARHRAGAPSEYVSRQIELHVESFDRNLREIAETSEEHGIRPVFIKQPIAILESAAERTYADRLAEATRRWQAGEAMTDEETLLLIHAAQMEALERVAAERDIPVVDNIRIVDERPDYMASYVHLTEEGNEALARALFTALRPMVEALPPGPEGAGAGAGEGTGAGGCEELAEATGVGGS